MHGQQNIKISQQIFEKP